ncbi:MAG: single-stranded-DNA-specific exonuclease RecJ [Armatimonadetes bacterium]|nr:single-stranded-DNA-specific exonuclease RecJ [Armatimonadota bacterium]
MTSNGADWVVLECDDAQVEKLAREANLPLVVARLLVLRGITTTAEARAFFDPSLDHLHDPSLLPDVDIGVERLSAAIKSGEKICVHGDYDVDGVTGTALLFRTLKALRANVDYYLPHRRRDGYGFKPAAVAEAVRKGAGLIITCDCGITAHDTIRRAKDAGIDVIITDHHEPGSELPQATAVINPKREDATYPFPELAGVGVAFKLAQGLVRRLGYDEHRFVERFTDLAAIGTVGDVVPLLGENRAIVRHGLEAISASKKVGLRTMIKATGLEGKPLNAYCLAYVLGPRINAAGRMDDATTALRLLLTKDDDEAWTLVREMERHNSQRRAEQERIAGEAVEQAQAKFDAGARVLVLSKEGWNCGVIGIVASKICELFGRPAILISRDEATGLGGGSARSIPEFNIIEALRSCEDLLERFGGHSLAAGLTIQLDKLEEFEERINLFAFEAVAEEELAPRLEIEAELEPVDITRELAGMIASMEPFGMGNPEPLFVTRNLIVTQKQRVGDGSHLKFQVQPLPRAQEPFSSGIEGIAGTRLCSIPFQERVGVRSENQPFIDCIGFGLGDLADTLELGGRVDLCYSIRIDDYNGAESVQLVVKDVRLRSDS